MDARRARAIDRAMSESSIETAAEWQVEGAKRYRAGDLAGATDALTRAAQLAPDEPAYLLNLAELARVTGRPDAARRHLERATALTGADVGRLNLLAAAWLDLGVHDRALDAAMKAIAAGGDANSRKLFADAVVAAPRPEARGLIERAMREDWPGLTRLRRPATAMLRAAWPGSIEGLAADELLAGLLVSLPIGDPDLEQRLTHLRRSLLLGEAGDAALPLLERLATQCHLNEYAWDETPEETAAVERLIAQVAAGAATGAEVLTLACYRALDGLEGGEALLEKTWPTAVRTVLEQQVVAAKVERTLGAALPALTPIRAGVSETVREQYEESPYPRWIKMAAQPAIPLPLILRALLPGVDLPPIPEAPEVLVAGCGTGQQALQVANYAGAKVLAVDLSRASLGYAARKTAEAGVGSVTYAQADLLELGGFTRTFDVIECSGVLHHLADPFEGARILVGLLRPGGLLRLGLYSALARAPLAPAKALARRYPATPQGLRALRAAVLRSAPADPLRRVLGFSDFYTASTCRDLLMHVQEHELTIDDLVRLLEANDLRFLGFTVPAPVRTAYRRAFPDDPAGTDLETWRRFEEANPQIFVGMYEFWAQKRA